MKMDRSRAGESRADTPSMLPSEDTGASMSGALVTTGRETTRSIIGDAAYERALQSVPPRIAEEYRRATSLTWVPLAVVDPVIEAMGRAAGRDPLDLQDQVARHTVERSLQSIWRVFLRLTSNEALLSRMPLIFSKSYNRGRLSTSFPRPDRAVVELAGWPQAPQHVLRSTRVGLEAVFQGAGRKAARVSLDRTSDGAIYLAAGLR
jgi:hypothetical protein